MFTTYYTQYLSIDKGKEMYQCLVSQSPNRDKLINKRFAYKIIITDYNGNRIVSVSPSVSQIIINLICSELKGRAFADILKLRQLHETGYRISMMHRMILNRNVIMNYSENNTSIEYLREYRKFIIRDRGDIVSYCKVSDVDYNFGNIVVWTDEIYRRKGYARELLLRTISICESEDIEPIYLVDSLNTASINLAKSVGFEIIQTEIIVVKNILHNLHLKILHTSRGII